MEQPDHSRNTPGTDAAFDLLSEIAIDPTNDGRYPNRTVLIPADSPDASSLISRAVAAHRPLVVVYADGREILAAPRSGAFARLKRLLARNSEPSPDQLSIPLPVDYRVEMRGTAARRRLSGTLNTHPRRSPR